MINISIIHTQNTRAHARTLTLTADQAGQGLAEKRQQLAQLREGPGVSGVALQHRAAGGHVEGGRIHRVHFSCLAPGARGSAPAPL